MIDPEYNWPALTQLRDFPNGVKAFLKKNWVVRAKNRLMQARPQWSKSKKTKSLIVRQTRLQMLRLNSCNLKSCMIFEGMTALALFGAVDKLLQQRGADSPKSFYPIMLKRMKKIVKTYQISIGAKNGPVSAMKKWAECRKTCRKIVIKFWPSFRRRD